MYDEDDKIPDDYWMKKRKPNKKRIFKKSPAENSKSKEKLVENVKTGLRNVKENSGWVAAGAFFVGLGTLSIIVVMGPGSNQLIHIRIQMFLGSISCFIVGGSFIMIGKDKFSTAVTKLKDSIRELREFQKQEKNRE